MWCFAFLLRRFFRLSRGRLQPDGGVRLFRHNGLHVEVVFDRDHPIGRDDPAGIADVILEDVMSEMGSKLTWDSAKETRLRANTVMLSGITEIVDKGWIDKD